MERSWFSTTLFTHLNQNSHSIFSASSMSSLVGCTVWESTVKRSRKIRISLNPTQRQFLKQWFGVSRFVYNTTIKLLQDSTIKANWKAIKTDILNSLPDWCKSVPYQIQSIAIKDACKAVSNAKKKFKDGGGISKMRLGSRKDAVQSCYIPKSAVSSKGYCNSRLNANNYSLRLTFFTIERIYSLSTSVLFLNRCLQYIFKSSSSSFGFL